MDIILHDLHYAGAYFTTTEFINTVNTSLTMVKRGRSIQNRLFNLGCLKDVFLARARACHQTRGAVGIFVHIPGHMWEQKNKQ